MTRTATQTATSSRTIRDQRLERNGRRRRRTRQEVEADAVALCALIPRRLIEQMQDGGEAQLDDIPADLIAERLRLYELHDV